MFPVAAQASLQRVERHAGAAPRPIFSNRARVRRSYPLLAPPVGLPVQAQPRQPDGPE